MIPAVEQYQRKLAKRLRCCQDTKETLLVPFRKSLEAYLETNPEPSMAQLCAAFGTPEAMAAQMMECVSPEDVKRYRKRQRVNTVIVCVLLAAVLAFAAYILIEKEYSNICIIDNGPIGTSFNIED